MRAEVRCGRAGTRLNFNPRSKSLAAESCLRRVRLYEVKERKKKMEISVTNLDIISFLLVRGYDVDRLEVNGKTIAFIFSDPRNTAKLAISEFYKDGLVPAKTFVAAIKQARDMMFEQKRQSSFRGKENDTTYQPAGR
jgi:hypothetical protein